MTTPEMAADTITAVAKNADRLNLTWEMRPGTVNLANSIGSASALVILDGDTIPVKVTSLIGQVVAGQRVMCRIVPPQGIYIDGSYGSGEWSTYTVGWTSSSGTPSIGNGNLTGRYMFLAGFTCAAEILFNYGSTTAALGRWFFSLPFPAKIVVSPDAAATGAAYIFDAGTANRTGICNVFPGATNLFVTVSPNGDMGAGTPQIWASGDQMRLSIVYEIAH